MLLLSIARAKTSHVRIRKETQYIVGHTAEDPMVFRDHRGNYHMFYEANILLNDGRTVQRERRKRPQIVIDPKRPGVPLALVAGVTGCPKGMFPGGHQGGGDLRSYSFLVRPNSNGHYCGKALIV